MISLDNNNKTVKKIQQSSNPILNNIENEYTFNLAKVFGAPVVLHSEIRDGSLRAVAQEEGVPILLYEAGEALSFDESSIRIGVHGIVNVLREINMLPKVSRKKHAKVPVVTKHSQWVRASESGMLRTIKALGDTVQKDEIVAYIDEPLDDECFEIKAPFDGIIIGKSEIPLVQAGDAVFHIAKFGDLETAEHKIGYFSEDAIEESEFHELNREDSIE